MIAGSARYPAAALALALCACAPAQPPRSSPRDKPGSLFVPAAIPTAVDPPPEPTCDPNADEGTRCGEQNSRYCYEGRCVTKEQCRALCDKSADEASVRCANEQEELCGDDDQCTVVQGQRCSMDLESHKSSCLALRCGDGPSD